MVTLAQVLTLLLGLLHVWIMILEMFLWTSSYGRKAFAMSLERAIATKVLAANQGLYNGFLAAGIFWGLSRGDVAVQAFFLVCILVAGIFGALTASKKIIFVQAIPALVTLVISFLAYH